MAITRKLIDYEGMSSAAAYYGQCAEDLRSLCGQIITRNEDLVSNYWNADTAISFQERFQSDHANKMENVAAALDEIATFINNYVANEQADDGAQANAIGV